MIKVETYTVANLSRATVGERFTYKGAEYTVEAVEPYTNPAGRECVAVTVSGFCSHCGALFEHTTRRRPKWLPKSCGRDHAKARRPKPSLKEYSHNPLQGSPLAGPVPRLEIDNPVARYQHPNQVVRQ